MVKEETRRGRLYYGDEAEEMTYIGHTNDGKVFLAVDSNYNGQNIRSTIEMDPSDVKEIIKNLESALESALRITDVRNSTHLN